MFLCRHFFAVVGGHTAVEVKVADEDLNVFFQISEDFLNPPHNRFEHMYPAFADFVNLLLDGLAKHQVDNQNIGLPADTLDSSNSLFEFHWIPGQVEVNHQVGALQVQALASFARTYQDATGCLV